MSHSQDVTRQGVDDSLESLVGRVADDYLARRERGESPDPEEYAARLPHAADLIRRTLAALALAGGSLAGAQPSAADTDLPDALGDFRLVREVGRGGMGVVYEAEQLSLRRRVAVKVLPFAAVMDPRHLQRFRNEALAAASLDHPHVVKVYGVGCERGVHFIALQFVDGRPLSDLIRDRRGESGDRGVSATTADRTHTPTPRPSSSGPRTRGDRAYYRRVAEWGAQAAEALEHAHGLGVVHRDVKPGNLLVDGAGAVYVADFGLAKLSADPGVTGSGDLLGTARYMSPEQAAAKHDLVDHRSDVYSLGVTLYELLALAPAFAGTDRQAVLTAVLTSDPPAPRTRDRDIPRDLETVVLKAMDKDPARRYQTAGDLAADLRRFAADEPVRAKPKTPAERVLRWAARRPRTLAGVAALLLAGLAALAYWDRERSVAEAAAREAATQAEELRSRRRFPEAEATVRRAAALLPRFGGDPELHRRVTDQVADTTLLRRLDDARLLRINSRLDATAIDKVPSLDGFAAAFREAYGVEVLSGDAAGVANVLRGRAIRSELTAALDDWAFEIEDHDYCLRLLVIADSIDEHPGGPASRMRRMENPIPLDRLRKLADEVEKNPPPSPFIVHLGMGLIESGDRLAGLRLLKLAHFRNPTDAWALAALCQLTSTGEQVDYAEALRYWSAARVLMPDSPTVLANAGVALNELGRPEEALDHLQLADRLTPDSPNVHNNLGVTFVKLKRTGEAEAEFRRAIALGPGNAQAWSNLGALLNQQHRWGEALAALREAAAPQPADVTIRVLLSRALSELRRFPEAEMAGREAVRLDPRNAEAHFRVGLALGGQQKWKEAAEAYRRSVECRPEAHAFNNLGGALDTLGRHAEAEEAYRQAIRLEPGYALAHFNLGKNLFYWKPDAAAAAEAFQEAVRLQPDLADAHFLLGNARVKLGDRDGAMAAFREAIRLRPEFAEAHCNLARELSDAGRYAEALPEFRTGDRLGRTQANWRYKSEVWVRECERQAALEERLPATLSGTHTPKSGDDAVALAGVCVAKRHFAAAVRMYREAFRRTPAWVTGNVGGYRYDAAVLAARAGCGEGADADDLTDEDRSALRAQAREWLGQELDLMSRAAARKEVRAALLASLRVWAADPGLVGVRDGPRLGQLPEAEQAAWPKLWEAVAELEGMLQKQLPPAAPSREVIPPPRQAEGK